MCLVFLFSRRKFKNSLGRTPLHEAVAAGRRDLVALLVAQGADLAGQDIFGRTPLHLAKSREIADYLIVNGAPIDAKDVYGITANPFSKTKNPPDIISCCFPQGLPAVNPTYMACPGCDHQKIRTLWEKEIIPYLVLHGADLNEPVYGDIAPLAYALMSGEFEFAKKLLRAGANGNNVINAMASCRSPLKNLKFLIAYGADAFVLDDDGNSTLINVVKDEMSEINAKIAPRSETKGIHEALLYLIKIGVSVNSTNKSGKTALHYAAYQNYPRTVKILLGNGANCNIKDRAGKTALDLAEEQGHREIINCLVGCSNPGS